MCDTAHAACTDCCMNMNHRQPPTYQTTPYPLFQLPLYGQSGTVEGQGLSEYLCKGLFIQLTTRCVCGDP